MEQENKNVTNKVSKQHKYRVSLYLGKELYETIYGVSQFLNLPVATTTRILLETGVHLANSLDKQSVNEVKKYGKGKKI